MCGRYSITTPPEAMARLFGAEGPVPNFPARYNIAPSTDVPVVRLGDDSGDRELTMLRWGLVPSWAKAGAKPLINARGESVAEKPSFRAAFNQRRCLMPADGFYEWHRPGEGPKQPYNIRPKGGGVFAMAALWETWTDASGQAVPACAIITTAANQTLAPIHHRMPVILAPQDWARWLETPAPQAQDLLPLLRPAPDDLLEAYPITTRVNRVANDGPELLTPVDPGEGAAEDPADDGSDAQGQLF